MMWSTLAQETEREELNLQERTSDLAIESPPPNLTDRIRSNPRQLTTPIREPQPTTLAQQLEVKHNLELLEITNEKLREEIEFLARENRESESTNNLYALGIGGAIALIFFVLGFWFGKKSARTDRYL